MSLIKENVINTNITNEPHKNRGHVRYLSSLVLRVHFRLIYSD